jgi:hypothetical protein
MKYVILAFMAITSLTASMAYAAKEPAYKDYSGVYTCTGDDAHEGKYTGTVTMTLKPEHSHDSYASYDFKLEVPGYGTYLGHAAANGNHVAMHFALTDQSTKDYGTGIAKMTKNAKGQWTFHKFYFEPQFKGGNTGVEDCTRK